MYKFAINRPITTLMIFISLVLFGVISIKTMSVNMFPEVEIPLVKITTYANGDKDYINNKITKRLEDEISAIDGIKNINSSSYNGISIILVEFNLKKDIEVALNDVRDKISKAGLTQKSITEKISGGDQPIFSIFVSAKDANTTKLMRVIDDKAKTFLQRINGVASVSDVGFLKPQINVRLDPFKLNKFNLTAQDVTNIIKLQNLQLPLGKLENSDTQSFLKSNFSAKDIDELKHLRLKNGVFLSDVAEVFLSHKDIDSLAINSQNGVMLEIKKLNGANTIKTIDAIKAKMPEFEALLGENFSVFVAFDKSENIIKHIKQVVFDMVLGVFLTAFIVFAFLRNASSTLIATIAIPISIISTFFIIDLLGYDINRLTLIALTLSIGIFVDDAIVVIENISKKLQNGEKNALLASFEGVREIAFSVFAISAVLLCVFVPIAFMDSIVGRYFNSFAMSVAGGIVVSFLVCIMLVPSLAARFISPKEGLVYRKTEPFFAMLDSAYESLLSVILKFKKSFVLLSLMILFFCMSLVAYVGTDFLPSEDNSEFNIFLKADPAVSLEAMSKISKSVLECVKADSRVKNAYLLIGYDDARLAYKAKIYVKLVPLSERKKRQKDIMIEYRNELKFKELQISVVDLPVAVDVGDNEPLQIVVMGDSLDRLDELFLVIKDMLFKFKGVVDISSKNEDKTEQIEVSIDRQMAKKLNISEYEIASIINASFSQNIVSVFDDGVNQYDIALRFDDKFRNSIENLRALRLKNSVGESFMLDSLASFKFKKELLLVPRHNKQNQLKILANIDGIPLGDVAEYIEENLPKILPNGYSYKFSGFVELMDDTNKAFIFTISLSAVLIYMILAALYESFILPFVIMISMPLAFGGVILGLFLSGNSFSLFVMIGSILLFGMVGKNAILLVDFANKFANSGIDIDEAVKKAGVRRLHAILMTTFAMIFAMLPLALSRGAGFEGNSPMAIAIISGLISSTILTLLIVPALFGVAYKMDKKLKKIYEREKI